MRTRIIAITIVSHDVDGTAEFWRKALDYPETEHWRDGVVYVELPADNEPTLLFRPVPEHKVIKNRVHLDVRPAERDQSTEIDRLVGLGATVILGDPAESFVVLADPEGNEFCFLPPK